MTSLHFVAFPPGFDTQGAGKNHWKYFGKIGQCVNIELKVSNLEA